MRRCEARWSDPRHGFLQGSASSPHSPVLLQGTRLRFDTFGEGEELTPHALGRCEASLLDLCRRRQLLALAHEFVFHQMQVLEYYRRGARTAGLEAACLRLQELCHTGAALQRKVWANQLLCPCSPPVHRALGNMLKMLQLMSVKAAIVTEELVLSAVRRAARLPAEHHGSLCGALTIYNKVVAEVAPWAAPWADMRPVSITRFLPIIAEERGWLLAGRFSQAGLYHSLQDVLKGEVESQEVGGALLSHLDTLISEDQCQAAALLKVLAGTDHVAQSGDEMRSLLYEQYCSRLWPLLCSHLYQALYPGGRAVMLTLSARGGRTAEVLRLIHNALQNRWAPELCREPVLRLCEHLLHTTAFVSWDRGTCWALSSALTDRCGPSLLEDGACRTHSRTCAILLTVCCDLSALLNTLSSGKRPPSPAVYLSRSHLEPSDLILAMSSPADNVSGHPGVLSRCAASLQLCDLWLRSRSRIYASSGSLPNLLLISHGDLPVIQEQMRSVTSATEDVQWQPGCQRVRGKLQKAAVSLEGTAACLPPLLGSVCSHRAQAIFQHMMPVGRHWRRKVDSGPDLVASEYAQAAVSAILVPLLQGVSTLSPEEQVFAVSVGVGGFMDAWMGHILEERMSFSLQGALQLRCDFECVRELLQVRDFGMSPEVVHAALSLPVFQQADNAIVCLLQQPSRKTYPRASGCSMFCCPPLCHTAVESVSDSLQSLDSLGRRVWSHNYPAQRPRHSHDSYLPHSQRQWLSLRLHKSWTGLS
ncbi:hypothetical protein PRIEUP_LOCUS308 [Pristimantis euphronides]